MDMKKLLCLFLIAASVSFSSEIVVLTTTPVEEFTLPDGSVLKNAFVWRRSSEGLMIVHDDGQYFLNFKLLPDEWRVAYLGEQASTPKTEVKEEGDAQPSDDRFKLQPILKKVPSLTKEGMAFLLREDADGETKKKALGLSFLQCLLSNNTTDARRITLIVEELELEFEQVDLELVRKDCKSCGGDGVLTRNCSTCAGTAKCVKCGGTGEREMSLSNSTIHCTTCRGSGDCADCGGDGERSSRCGTCKQRGWLLNAPYCEVNRDYLAHQVNALADDSLVVAVTRVEPDLIGKVMKELPGLNDDARRYYMSDEYDGSADADILSISIIHSLIKDRKEVARRFFLMTEAYFPDDENLSIDTYLKPCERCELSGTVKRDCKTCGGSGGCHRCGGDGQRDSDLKGRGTFGSRTETESKQDQRTVHCTTCRGSGNCVDCSGKGHKVLRCGSCNGVGRIFEEERAKIKLQILEDKLNDHHRKSK